MATKSLTRAGEMFPSVFEDFFKPWNDWFNGGLWGKTMTVPNVNITDNKNEYMLSMAAPGLKKDDFKIDVDGNMLTISSEKEEKDVSYTRKEYSYSSFSRSFTLPDEVNKEKVEAAYEDGVLKLTLPKKEDARINAAKKQITVK